MCSKEKNDKPCGSNKKRMFYEKINILDDDCIIAICYQILLKKTSKKLVLLRR